MNMAEDVLLDPETLPWMPLVEGIRVRVLRTCAQTGTWTVLLRCDAGSSFARHRHYGAGEYYVIRGHMEYRAGKATAGTYGYEPLGAVHDKTTFVDETDLLFTNHGPVLFLDEDDQIVGVLNHETLERMAAEQAAG